MSRPWAAVIGAAIGLGCCSCSGTGPSRATSGANASLASNGDTRTAPITDPHITRVAGVPLALAFDITPTNAEGGTEAGKRAGERFTVTGNGECYHFAHPADHAGVEWEVRYRGESGPGIRMLLLRTATPTDGTSDDVDVQLDAGDAMRLIHGAGFSRTSPDPVRDPDSARVSIAPLHAGVRLTLDGVSSDGAHIGGRIDCSRVSDEP